MDRGPRFHCATAFAGKHRLVHRSRDQNPAQHLQSGRPATLRRVRFRIDGGVFRTPDESTQPQRETNLLVQGLNPGRHIVEIGCLDRVVEKDDKTRGVRLVGLGSTGVTQG
jgi:hypothetical protein